MQELLNILSKLGDTEHHACSHVSYKEFLEDKGLSDKELKMEASVDGDEIEELFKNNERVFEYSHNAWDNVIYTSNKEEVINFLQEAIDSY